MAVDDKRGFAFVVQRHVYEFAARHQVTAALVQKPDYNGAAASRKHGLADYRRNYRFPEKGELGYSGELVY